MIIVTLTVIVIIIVIVIMIIVIVIIILTIIRVTVIVIVTVITCVRGRPPFLRRPLGAKGLPGAGRHLPGRSTFLIIIINI